MATIHIFNPEHDIALAADLSNFTAPHAGRQLRSDLGFLPALWTQPDDVVLVDDLEHAEKSWRRLQHRIKLSLYPHVSAEELPTFFHSPVHFFPSRQIFPNLQVDSYEPWGWDKALKSMLKRKGFPSDAMPSDEELDDIRQKSHRRLACLLLPQLQTRGTIGESFECIQEEEVETLLQKYGQIVMKAPWSSSGRGIRFLSQEKTPFQMQERWFHHLLARQGSVMVEPFYHKVKDFGMEFYADGEGRITYLGLSLFHTINGAYIGNILATENAKKEMIRRYISIELLEEIKQKIYSCLSLGKYKGPFGIDMMIVKGKNSFLLHPCVEINLRRTMGHVALAMTPHDDEIIKVMRIELTDHYKLKINKL